MKVAWAVGIGAMMGAAAQTLGGFWDYSPIGAIASGIVIGSAALLLDKWFGRDTLGKEG